MPKLLQINVTANWGSTGKIAEAIGVAAMAHGWESYIAYGRCCNQSKSQLIKIGDRWDKYFHFVEQRICDNEGLCSRSATKRLIQQIEEIKPDIVQLHNIHDHYLNYRILFEYLNQTKIRVVWTFHDFWAITGHCMHFISTACARYQSGCHDCLMRTVYPKAMLDKSARNWELKRNLFSANQNLTIVPVSEWVGEQVRKSFLKDKEICVIPNGIDMEVFKPTVFEDLHSFSKPLRSFFDLTKDKFIIMSVASQWKFDKGLDDYKRISDLLKEDEVIVLVGVDENIIRFFPKNIIGIKRINNPHELAALYTRADVVTILSSAETFGLTAIEGFACGTPAVVYNNTAPPSLITPETGIVVPDKDYQSVYAAIQKLKKCPLKDEDCITRVRNYFDKNKCFEKYIELYERLIK